LSYVLVALNISILGPTQRDDKSNDTRTSTSNEDTCTF